ncbi:uncharacterized protein JCM6883_005510 [Sporobolomyces salmoneus]|uniref:uncharacterized protein n=1 Tax=Sporobolomyces salmoneus TaxID=183962 RepID=UPI00316C4EED
MASSILPPPPPPPSFQPLRQTRASKSQRAHRLSVSSTPSGRHPFSLLHSNSSSTLSSFASNSSSTLSSFASGQGLLRPPPVAVLNDRRTTRTGGTGSAAKRVKVVGNALDSKMGKMRASRWEHGTIQQQAANTVQIVDLDLASNPNATLGLGLGAPISLSLNPRSMLSSSLDLPFVPSSSSASTSATNDDLLTPLTNPSPPRVVPSSASSTFDPSSFSTLGSLGSSRRHSRLGMLKHRNKSLLSNGSPASIKDLNDSTQHPRSPSIDITSAFPQTEPGVGGGGGDAFQLFEEAFPYPSSSEEATDKAISSPLVKLLSSPSIPITLPIADSSTSNSNAEANARAQASGSVRANTNDKQSKSRPSSIESVKGLKELELVKRRLSWESLTTSTNRIKTTELLLTPDGTLTDEEQFEDALEEGEPTLIPTHPRLSPIRRSSFPSTAQISPIAVSSLPTTTEDTLSLGLGLGIDLLSSSSIAPLDSGLPLKTDKSMRKNMLPSREELQGPLNFDELKELDDQPLNEGHGLGLGLGLGIVRERDFDQGAMGLGLGIGIEGEDETEEMVEEFQEDMEKMKEGITKRTVGEHIEEESAGAEESQRQLNDLFEDPPTPLLAPLSPVLSSAPKSLKSVIPPSTPVLTPQRQETASSPVKHVSPRRQPRSPPRAKKVSLLKLPSLSQKMKNQRSSLLAGGGSGQIKRVYPRATTSSIAQPESVGMLGKKIKEAKLRNLIANSNAAAMPQEDQYYGSPNLSDLPGSFLASPVLPTSFADFSHSPLSPIPTPTPTSKRFARMRRGGNQTAPLPEYAITAHNSFSPILPTTTPAAALANSTYCPPGASSTLDAPSVPATPTLGTPTLAASPSFASDVSAPSTPIPDQAVVQTSSSATETGGAAAAAAAGHAQSAQMNQQLFDAAIASTILGAIVCIGAVSWLAISVFKKGKGDKGRKGYSGRGIGSDDAKGGRFSDDLDDEKYRASPASTPGGNGRLSIAARGISAPILTDLPKPPPLARLSFPPGNNSGSGGANDGPERSFSSHFDAWVDASTRRALQGASTEDHGGYPEEAVRGDGMSTNERRMSRASRHSVQSFGAASRNYPRSLHTTGNRSSYRSSTGPSLIDSTWSARPGTAYSSRTSHHDPSKEYTDSTAPPRLPSPILRNSVETSDVAAYFATPPDTPTKSLRSYFNENEVEPPVPSLPSDYRDLSSSVPNSAIKTRQRATSKSNGSKATTSNSKIKSVNLKTMPALSSIITPDEGHESPTEAALRKLEKRRATVDGGILADGLQALLFQAQLDSPTKGMTDSNTEEKSDIFSTSVGGNGSAQIKRNSVTMSSSNGLSASTSSATSKGKSPKKNRPQTMPHMPPTIVVSSDQVPPTPASRQRTRTRTKTSDSNDAQHQSDPRASIKTYEQSLPWLAHSPSSNFSVHPRDDAGSVIDPEMRSVRHFSVDTNRFSVDSMPPPPKRFSQDFASFTANRASQHAPLDSIDIASRRLASEDDLASQGGDGGNDTDEEEARRTQRRKTLLYSVYKQRGVDLSPTSPSTTSIAAPPTPQSLTNGTSPDSLNTLSRTSLSDESTADTPTKGAARDLLVSSFPSPPPLPTEAPAFASLVANLESTMNAAASLANEPSSSVSQPPTPGRSGSSGSVKAIARSRSETVTMKENDVGSAQNLLRDPSEVASPPVRPSKSPIRMSVVPDASSLTTSPSSRIPLPSRQPVRQPFAPVNSANGGVNSIRGPLPPSSSSTAVSKPTTVSAPPVRSFAAELQESVGNPAEGYDSDTLMSGLAFNKPGRSFFSSGVGSMSNSSSGYGYASGMYSTNPGSMESMEEVVAISHAETVQFGRSRASGIPQFSWKRNTAGLHSSGIGQYDSEESAYEESDAETAMFRARMEPIAE